MDPNANLLEQERLLDRLTGLTRTDVNRLLELRQALYDWIRDGGFEPDWSKAPKAREYFGR